MKKELISEMYRLETTHWWHVAKRRLVQGRLSKDWPVTKKVKLLDAGCGTGAMLFELKDKFDVFGADVSAESLSFCRNRKLANLRLVDFERKLPYKNNAFSVIVCLDVLEHVENDRQLLDEFHRILKKGGRLYLTVPAYQFLWTYWDEILGHKRRYRKSNLVKLFGQTNFRIVHASYFYSFLLPIVIPFRFLKSAIKNSSSDFVQLPLLVNKLMLLLCFMERKIQELVSLPFGLSIFMVAEKK